MWGLALHPSRLLCWSGTTTPAAKHAAGRLLQLACLAAGAHHPAAVGWAQLERITLSFFSSFLSCPAPAGDRHLRGGAGQGGGQLAAGHIRPDGWVADSKRAADQWVAACGAGCGQHGSCRRAGGRLPWRLRPARALHAKRGCEVGRGQAGRPARPSPACPGTCSTPPRHCPCRGSDPRAARRHPARAARHPEDQGLLLHRRQRCGSSFAFKLAAAAACVCARVHARVCAMCVAVSAGSDGGVWWGGLGPSWEPIQPWLPTRSCPRRLQAS